MEKVAQGYMFQDPIGLAGGNPNIYAYTKDVNSEVDVFGLAKGCPKANNPKEAFAIINKKEWKCNSTNVAHHSMDGAGMKEMQNAIDRIKTRDTTTYPGKDGSTFENSPLMGPNSQRLNTSDTYEEWTVKTPGVSNRGERRIVVDRANNRAYYSHDHYESFIEIDLSGW